MPASIEISIPIECTYRLLGEKACKHPVEATVLGPNGWIGMCMGHMNISNLEGTVQLLKAMVTR